MILLRKIGFIVFIGMLSCNQENKTNSLSGIEKHSEIASVNLSDLKGQPIDMENYKGKTVFINFWATWCKPCIKEMSSIEKAQRQLAAKGVVFLLASNESIPQIKEFCDSREYKLDFIRVDNFEDLNIQALPTTFIFSSKGSLVFSETGSRNWDENTNINLILNIANAK